MPRLSKNRLRLPTFSLSGFWQHTLDCRLASPAFALRENRQTSTPTLPSFLWVLIISRAFRSSQTRKPSFICSLSTLRFRSTSAPATPVPQTKSPDVRSTLQHSRGRMFAATRVDRFGRRDRDRLRRMETRLQCRRLAARCVRVKYIVELGGCRVCSNGRRGSRWPTRLWLASNRHLCSSGSSESARHWRQVWLGQQRCSTHCVLCTGAYSRSREQIVDVEEVQHLEEKLWGQSCGRISHRQKQLVAGGIPRTLLAAYSVEC